MNVVEGNTKIEFQNLDRLFWRFRFQKMKNDNFTFVLLSHATETDFQVSKAKVLLNNAHNSILEQMMAKDSIEVFDRSKEAFGLFVDFFPFKREIGRLPSGTYTIIHTGNLLIIPANCVRESNGEHPIRSPESGVFARVISAKIPRV